MQLINLDVYSGLFSLGNCTVYLKSHGGKCMVLNSLVNNVRFLSLV